MGKLAYWSLIWLGCIAGSVAGEVQEWSTQGGHQINGELVEYSWSERSLMLKTGPKTEPLPVSAQDLDLRSKIRLLFAEPFQDSFLAHREELNVIPVYRLRLEQLRQSGVVFAAVWIACLATVSCYLAGAILRKPSLGLWCAVLLFFLGLSALGGWGVFEAFARFEKDKAWKVAGMAGAAHSVILIFAVWGIYRCGVLRAMFWWALNWILAIVLPVAIVSAVLAGQIYLRYHALDEGSLDKYLSEVWLVPMGLI